MVDLKPSAEERSSASLDLDTRTPSQEGEGLLSGEGWTLALSPARADPPVSCAPGLGAHAFRERLTEAEQRASEANERVRALEKQRKASR